MSEPKQFSIPFPERRLAFEDLEITEANQLPVVTLKRAEQWPYPVFCLVGPLRSGLTTLAQAWAEHYQGVCWPAMDMHRHQPLDIDRYAAGYVAIDNADQLESEQVVLNLINGMQRLGGRLLLTSHIVPGMWQSISPDLASRLKSAPLMTLGPPDEAMMRARIQAAGRQVYLDIPKAVEDYLITRLGLDYIHIDPVVQYLAGAVGQRRLSVPLAREVLSATSSDD